RAPNSANYKFFFLNHVGEVCTLMQLSLEGVGRGEGRDQCTKRKAGGGEGKRFFCLPQGEQSLDKGGAGKRKKKKKLFWVGGRGEDKEGGVP
ncbi:hypothetical protein DNR41_27325, partial [Escherichia coli]